jgi:CMP-N-acetylneuraminic acid synthetase
MRVVAFVPMKLNNERLPNKNTKPFDNGKPLLHYVFATLRKCRGIDAIYAYCSDRAVVQHLPSDVRYLARETILDRPETLINEVMLAFAKAVEADVYVLAHATAPFISAATIELGISKILHHEYDSALSVMKLQEFFWKDGKPMNYDPRSIPRTQDLHPIHVETTGLYIYRRELIVEQNRRVGDHPFLIEVSRIEGTDINDAIDFAVANALASAGLAGN